GQFDPSRGSLRAFLYGVARNHVLRRLERERGLVALEDDSGDERGGRETGSAARSNLYSLNLHGPSHSGQDPYSDFARQEDAKRVREAVLSLPALYREAVVLCDLEEKNYVEAAQALGCAVGTVRSRLHRARSLLIRKLGAIRQTRDDAERLSAAERKP
ncbi:MAG: RNA polymerase sigma factor, partial [Terriglobia bacterium]